MQHVDLFCKCNDATTFAHDCEARQWKSLSMLLVNSNTRGEKIYTYAHIHSYACHKFVSKSKTKELLFLSAAWNFQLFYSAFWFKWQKWLQASVVTFFFYNDVIAVVGAFLLFFLFLLHFCSAVFITSLVQTHHYSHQYFSQPDENKIQI